MSHQFRGAGKYGRELTVDMLLMFAVFSPHFVTRARTSTLHLVIPGWLIWPSDMTMGPMLTLRSVKLRRLHSWIEERKRKRQPSCQFRSNSGGLPGRLTSLLHFIVNGLVAQAVLTFKARKVAVLVGTGSPILVRGRFNLVLCAPFLSCCEERERECVCVCVSARQVESWR